MACNGCGQVAYSGSLTTPQTVAAGFPLTFEKNFQVGCTSTGNSVTLERPGLYHICVSGSAATTAGTATDVKMALMNNGNPIADVEAVGTSTSTTDFEALSFSCVLRVNPTTCCMNDNAATLTVENLDNEATYENITMSVVRI